MPYSVAVGYERFGEPWYLHLQVVTLYSDVIEYLRFGELRCLHFHSGLKAAWSS